MARKRKDGKRSQSGRLSRSLSALRERNAPSQRVIERQDRFRVFMGDSAIGHEMTCAGRLMLVGCFDDMDETPEAILSALLEYASGYWSNYGGGPGIAAYERQDRSHDSVWEDGRGQWFDAIDGRLRAAGHDVRRAVHEVTVDRRWFPDEDVSWAARIINTRFLAKRLPIAGELACESDWAMLELLKAGALALIGRRMKRAA